MNMRLASPTVVVDINGIEELKDIRFEAGVLRIGGLARHAQVAASDLIARHAPLIHKAMPEIAHPAVRNRGTFGGSLCHADPASELPACALALRARFNIRSAARARTVDAAEFFKGTYTTCLAANEILVSVDVPAVPAGAKVFFEELVRRKGDYAMVGLAAQAVVGDGRILDPRLVFFAVGDAAIEAKAAALIDGRAPGDVDADAVCAALEREIRPFADLTTSAAAKTHMMKVLVRRALRSFAA
jgi:carbon-monoxide dehydrogenase medium subunit